MTNDLPFEIVELVPCPLPASIPVAPLREVSFRSNAWLPDEIDTLRAQFAADDDLQAIADDLDRPLSGVQAKLSELGLRRNSRRPWTQCEDAHLAQHYGTDATSTIAARLGRAVSAIYARASLLGLTEGNALAYTEWEIAQIRAGYARGVPVNQVGVLIGRPASGIASVASKLGIKHADSPPDWTGAEQQRALALAEKGRRYRQIAADLAADGFPRREHGAVGQVLRKLGYGRGWGRPWTDEEDDLLRHAYSRGESLKPLRTRLGRSGCSIRWRVRELGLQGTHARPNGWRTDPPWNEEEIAVLRRDYGRGKTAELARTLGRSKGGVFNKAWSLGLTHGYIRPFTDDEKAAIRLAHAHGVSLPDLSAALDRDPAVVSKHAIRMRVPFSARKLRAPRTRRVDRVPWTLASILALQTKPSPAVTAPVAAALATPPQATGAVLVALPGLPPMKTNLLAAMHAAGLVVTVAQSVSIVLVAPRTV